MFGMVRHASIGMIIDYQFGTLCIVVTVSCNSVCDMSETSVQ